MYRVFVEKKPAFRTEADRLFSSIQDDIHIASLTGIRLVQRYDVEGLSAEEFATACQNVFSEAQVDDFSSTLTIGESEVAFAVQYLPGQFDQRADSAAQCIELITGKERPVVASAKVYILSGELSEKDLAAIKAYLINPVDSREASLALPETLHSPAKTPADVAVLEDFLSLDSSELEALRKELGLAMSLEDLLFCQSHFRDEQERCPTITELKLLDTYWSDHCRHTTFLTKLGEPTFPDDGSAQVIEDAYKLYLSLREEIGSRKPITLMDMALVAMRYLRKTGKLANLEESEEVNAASIVVPVEIDGQTEEWLLMFKNETHNHPTEIEPFGGAATCLGGAIRDPLSGRAYVYQAMRVTGAADPRTPFEDTLPGKLSQKKITTGAAHGYSSYGNQIGLATGAVREFYHPNFVAKRMEVGAVVAAAPRSQVFRGTPETGDLIILIGGRTGRDGVCGATGSSKEHTETALENSAEVQKGDPPMERKLQRLFRNHEFSKRIKRCNDFGAGGVSVAIGELADSLEINLDQVALKYEGLDGTEIALSESQERMAIVIAPEEKDFFIQAAAEENLEARHVATVTDSGKLIMTWRGKEIVSLPRRFLDTNGVQQSNAVAVNAPDWSNSPLQKEGAPLETLVRQLNHTSQRGLIEQFDSTIGASTVLYPLGGYTQSTPSEAMAAKIPLQRGETDFCSLMSYGYHPDLAQWSPFHGAYYAVVESVTRIVAAGGNLQDIRLTFQEYFEKLGTHPEKWGKPFSALLGALLVQKELSLAAIGGKDSMSGTFKDIDVPPTLVSFAVAPARASQVISPEWKEVGSQIFLIETKAADHQLLDLADLIEKCALVQRLRDENRLRAVQSIKMGGIGEALFAMAVGNEIGIETKGNLDDTFFTRPRYGAFLIELSAQDAADFDAQPIGQTIKEFVWKKGEDTISLAPLKNSAEATLRAIFPPISTKSSDELVPNISTPLAAPAIKKTRIAQPRVTIPVFPGTNCEYDSARVFLQAGAQVDTPVFVNLTPRDVQHSIQQLADSIRQSQILMLAGGFSAGDEPEGSGKFNANTFRNPILRDAVMELLNHRDGLVLGICNGFQALVKLGLLPHGEIHSPSDQDPTLTFNHIGRHISRYVTTRIASNSSPWLQKTSIGDRHAIPVSHGEGRFVAPASTLEALVQNGQVATQYVDATGKATMSEPSNPNGSSFAIEGITSLDGRILGKMGHSERIGKHICKNIPGNKDQQLFASGVAYFS